MKQARTKPFRTAALAGLALLATAASAWAGPVTVLPAAISSEFENQLVEDYGVREGVYLRGRVDRALERALARVGGSPASGSGVRIETTIETARPNRPTFEQLGDTPGLDYMRSFGTGGATLSAVLRGADGAPLGEVHHHYYSYDIRYTYANTTWHDADRAISGFARKVADEYARVSH